MSGGVGNFTRSVNYTNLHAIPTFLTWYTYLGTLKCACLLGYFFAKFGISTGVFHQEYGAKIIKVGVF